MRLINFLFVLLLNILPIGSVISSSPTLARNYFVASGRKSVTLSTSEADSPGPRYYTATFVDTVNTISNIYYATAEINAQTSSSSYPGTANDRFIWYEIDTANYSSAHLTTAIVGYFQWPYISYFTYSYLLVLANNPLVGTYITISELVYTPAVAAVFVNFPSTYQASDTISFSYMIKQIKKVYTNANLASNQYAEYIGMSVYDFTSTFRYRFNIALPTYLTGTNYSISYIAFILDRTTLARDRKRSTINTATYLTIGGSAIGASFGQNVFEADFNMFLGIGKYYFFNDQEPSFKFSISKTLSSFTATFYGALARGNLSSNYFAYSYAFFGQFNCPQPYFVYNDTLNLCYNNCTSTSYYFNQTTNTCQPCPSFCLTCYSDSSCTTCYSSTFRQLVGYKCVPIDGYYEANTSIAAQCSTSSCATCFGTATNCTKCQSAGQFLVNNTCLTCIDIFQGCSTCNQTACFACNSSYILINSSHCGLPCASSACKVCSNQNTSHCYECRGSYVLQAGSCVTASVCGDLIISSTEQCDDGNTVSRDGCDSGCAVEQYYQCYSAASALGYSYTLYCAYLRPIELTLVSIEKLSYANAVRAIVSVKQYEEAFWSTKASLAHFLVQSPVAYKDMRVQFLGRPSSSSSSPSARLALKLGATLASQHPQSSLLAVTFEYLQPSHNQQVALGFNFSQSWDYALRQIPASSAAFALAPDNGHYAELYSQAVYARQRQLADLLAVLSAAAVLLFALSFLVGGRRVCSEMLVVFQITYAGLLALPGLTPLFAALASLSHASNGYNLMYTTQLRPFEDALASSRLKAAGLYSQFLFNFNAGALFILGPLLAGLMLLLLAKAKRFASEEARQKVQRAGASAMGEYAFAGLVFGGCAVGVAAVLEVRYGVAETASTGGMLSLAAAAVLLALYPAYGFARVAKRDAFAEYNEALLRDVRASLAFQVAYFYLGLASAAVLCLCPPSMANGLACALPVAFFVATLARPLFRKPADKYRTQLNLLSIVLAQLPFVLAHWQGGRNASSNDDMVLMAPLAVGLVLSLNFAANLAFLLYELYKKIREKLYSDGGAVPPQPEKITHFNHANHFARPMLSSFIEYTKKESEELQLMKNSANGEALNSKSSLFLSSLKKGIHEAIRPRKVMQEEVELGPI